MKICLVASRGGHVDELAFASDLNGEMFLITEKSTDEIKFCNRVYYVDHMNRKEPKLVRKMLKLFIEAAKIIRAEKPDCYISTGALISVPVLILGKLSGKKIVFIESLARVETPSISGRIVYRFADVFVVYWKSLLKFYPKARYINLIGEDLE